MYNHAPRDYQCPFCLLTQGIKNEAVESVFTDIICQNTQVTAFVSSHQWLHNPGNVIIVPNKHFENIFDLPPNLGGYIQEAAQIIAIAMKEVYGCDGVSTRQHNEPAGSQDIWHYHLHVTPRFYGDRLYRSLATDRALMPPEERAWHAQRLSCVISDSACQPVSISADQQSAVRLNVD
jgi:histidine triad (HIT) family protein